MPSVQPHGPFCSRNWSHEDLTDAATDTGPEADMVLGALSFITELARVFSYRLTSLIIAVLDGQVATSLQATTHHASGACKSAGFNPGWPLRA